MSAGFESVQHGGPEFVTVLLETMPPFDVDWQKSALEMDESARYMRLARVKAILPLDNAIEGKTTHDATLENYIRLALHAAGDLETLDGFLGLVQGVLEAELGSAEMLAQQVFWIWAPAAEIAGLYQRKEGMEEAAFKTMMPEEHARICQEYDRTMMQGSDGLLERMRARMNTLLGAALDQNVSFSISARPKSNYSVWRKLRADSRQNAQLFDLLGFRVILDGEEDVTTNQCYVAMAAIAAEFESEKSRLKDYIAEPKATGYQSLHLTLYTAAGFPFELQVRTRQMHNYAESDNALSHQTYEATFKEIPGKIKKVYQKVPRLYRWRNQATGLMRDQGGKTEGILGDNILFFRPDGNLYKMPSNGNVLDASFRIHSHRALRTRHVMRNGRPVGLGSSVEHGDVIKVDYWPTYPTEAARFDTYHHMVNTTYARKAVESGKRQALRDDYRRLGETIIVSMVGPIGIDDPLSVLDAKDRRRLADKAGLPSFENLLELIGAHERSAKPGRVVNLILTRCGLGPELVIKQVQEGLSTLPNDEVLKSLEVPNVNGNPVCKIGGCCSEKIRYGDPVIARPSRMEGVLKIHLTVCKNVRDFSDTMVCSWV